MTRQPARVDWPQPFPPEEYAMRRRKVAEALAGQGLDGMFVTNPADICYLTGYDMIWFHLRCLTGCLITAPDARLVFFDTPMHRTMVELTPGLDGVVWLDGTVPDGNAAIIAAAAQAELTAGAQLGLQPWGYSPHARTMDTLKAALQAKGLVPADASGVIELIRLYKSPAEIAHIRGAARIADTAMIRAREALVPGLLETELQGIIMGSMMADGGGDPGIRCMIGSGPRAGTHHSPAQHRPLGNNELVFIDFCAALHRYHVNLNRTFALGEVDPRWFDLMDRAAATIDRITEAFHPGMRLSEVHRIGNEWTDAQGLRDKVWVVGGYALGIAMPPDWVGEIWVGPRYGSPDCELKPGMVFNFEGQFDDTEGWAGGTGAAYIETLLVTETGLEVLSTLPRGLVAV
ncbi:aminopeptidase P family protein [Rhodobacteraceae bacterium 2376]|uniref:Aminopeptidase P family protein n=1 Tax=Rhabdonatronobacter sediminivivens TaxID=2743469 RepID=A0A7Z0HYZ3_9RHOB|nr:Xaa-Pro peptidase family protein [Rhabdonatronobacter sediminivivens]NYS24775.1 aminopeptidase P family protein [Rhabdonatronobacter sediminivivens]